MRRLHRQYVVHMPLQIRPTAVTILQMFSLGDALPHKSHRICVNSSYRQEGWILFCKLTLYYCPSVVSAHTVTPPPSFVHTPTWFPWRRRPAGF